MPEVTFRLRWPDDSETLNYSPSSIVRQYLTPGATYQIGDFIQRARLAMQAASARVEQKYGHPCSRARATLDSIELQAKPFTKSPSAAVTVTAMRP